MIKKGWKLVWYANELKDYYRSALGDYKANRYHLGKWTEPRKGWGPLCVFNTKRNATMFRKKLMAPHYAIMRCEYEPSNSDKIWRKMLTCTEVRLLCEAPYGTVLATRVRLLRK
jgi:hypothetical protein